MVCLHSDGTNRKEGGFLITLKPSYSRQLPLICARQLAETHPIKGKKTATDHDGLENKIFLFQHPQLFYRQMVYLNM
jgi:hypothetical protein